MRVCVWERERDKALHCYHVGRLKAQSWVALFFPPVCPVFPSVSLLIHLLFSVFLPLWVLQLQFWGDPLCSQMKNEAPWQESFVEGRQMSSFSSLKFFLLLEKSFQPACDERDFIKPEELYPLQVNRGVKVEGFTHIQSDSHTHTHRCNQWLHIVSPVWHTVVSRWVWDIFNYDSAAVHSRNVRMMIWTQYIL